jgi:hypothetical protein
MRLLARPRFATVLFVIVLGVPALSAQTSQVSQAARTAALKDCADARLADLRKTDADRAKRLEDANAKQTIGLRNCDTDQPCRDKVIQTYRDETRQIQNDYTQATTDIRKKEIDCTTAAQSGKPDPNNAMYQLAAEIDAIRNKPLENMLAAADSLFKGLLDWASGTLNFLAQPRGDFGQFGAPMQSIIDYLVNHKPTSFQDQYKKMQAAVQQYQQNPARFIGQQIPNLIPGGKATEEMTAMGNAARKLATLNAEAKQFAPFAERLVTPTKLPPLKVEPPPLTGGSRGSFLPPAGSPDRIPPPDVGNGPLRPRSGMPPTCFENQCWRNVQAVDTYWKTGVWKEPTPRGYPYVEELNDLPTPRVIVTQELKRGPGGGANALDPRLGPDGQLNQSFGIPTESSHAEIENIMRNLPPGSQGYAFIDWAITVGNDVAKGNHVVNVRTLQNNAVEFFDRATQHVAGLQGAVDPQMWANARRVYFFLTHEGR